MSITKMLQQKKKTTSELFNFYLTFYFNKEEENGLQKSTNSRPDHNYSPSVKKMWETALCKALKHFKEMPQLPKKNL